MPAAARKPVAALSAPTTTPPPQAADHEPRDILVVFHNQNT
jgi:hypothetical protein